MISTILLWSCNYEKSPWVESLPISASELHIKQGDCFAFKDSSKNYFIGIIINFHKSEDGIWYAVCFTDYYQDTLPTLKSINNPKFCSRKVGSGGNTDYKMGLDIVWINDNTFDTNKIAFIGNINLALVSNLMFASEYNAFKYSDFISVFYRSKSRRLEPPDDFRDIKEHFQPDEYFSLNELEEWYKSSIKHP